MLKRLVVNDVSFVEFNLRLIPLLADPALAAVSPDLVVLHLVVAEVPGEN